MTGVSHSIWATPMKPLHASVNWMKENMTRCLRGPPRNEQQTCQHCLLLQVAYDFGIFHLVQREHITDLCRAPSLENGSCRPLQKMTACLRPLILDLDVWRSNEAVQADAFPLAGRHPAHQPQISQSLFRKASAPAHVHATLHNPLLYCL